LDDARNGDYFLSDKYLVAYLTAYAMGQGAW